MWITTIKWHSYTCEEYTIGIGNKLHSNIQITIYHSSLHLIDTSAISIGCYTETRRNFQESYLSLLCARWQKVKKPFVIHLITINVMCVLALDIIEVVVKTDQFPLINQKVFCNQKSFDRKCIQAFNDDYCELESIFLQIRCFFI